MIPCTLFGGRRVAVFGLGLSGIAAAKALQAGGADVLAWDDKPETREKAQAAGVPLADLNAEDWSGIAALVLAPGVPLTHPKPHWTVEKAKAAGIEVIGDTELLFREKEAQGSAARVLVITGTNGKSTTTALTAHLLEEAGKRVALGGNIGRAVLDLDPFADDLTYVLELSSFQIDLTPSLHPNAGALLNITPDHLDRHGTLEAYAAIKARIFALMGAGDTAVIGIDDAPSRAIAKTLQGPYAVKQISVTGKVETGVYGAEATLHEMAAGDEIATASLDGIASLRGAHNWQNAAAAYALARAEGLSREEIARGLKSFGGLAHRMEQVAKRGSVLFVNDSKATNADAAAKALASFQPIYWIVGGRAKAGGLSGLESYYPHIAKAYLIGEAAEDFAAQLGDAVPHTIAGTLDEAVRLAAADAASDDAAEPVVLLSPACASYDQFPNFEMRGDAFRKAVTALEGVTAPEGAVA
ncbi:UDP-N-acetylmuramoyl-L-alanine--D-glutamate ligase [Methyloligella sp. 2.7D]|uniref:UDP-N-acetylmuramoyl-L-alanine--D-glutamate ligase n=1 Tax=unclassified Methyloligella TaxID=2625955 RepID=UPI00157CE014|nr:UDP-N-acetylmuramoyl-L-alanine--D-glutamate ligase [Methyloligella sp. GL2]QKP77993.1 UDP-N-acetylmuramoyl-L-alanine--D-glutamate ligase [Methyloligella sp. GL2]